MAEKHDVDKGQTSQQEEPASKAREPTKVLAAVAIVLVLLFIVVLLWVLLSRPEAAVECVTVDKDLARFVEPTLNDSRKYVDNQLIITGPEDQVRRVAAENNLRPIRTCSLNYLRRLSEEEDVRRAFSRFTAGGLAKLTTNLYGIPDGVPLEDLVNAINEAGRGLLSAEVNLILGTPPSVCGSTHTDAGSPFGGPPKLLPVGEETAVKWFWQQWAFQQTGVGPFFKDAAAGAAILHQGEGTLVGVFDSSPFLDPWASAQNPPKEAVAEVPETIKWVNPAMDLELLTLKVSYPEMVSNPIIRVLSDPAQLSLSDTAETDSSGMPSDERDHGIFVAGLVHAVAPASEIRLIRVLNEHGCGSLYTLYEALQRFVTNVERERGDLQGVVINLSLGYYDEDQEIDRHSCDKTGATGVMALLCSTLSYAKEKGAWIVAAAGNDSDQDDRALPAQLPAGYPFVLGVSASTKEGQLACYSNQGDLSAPGGGVGRGGEKKCPPVVEACGTLAQDPEGDCPEAIIGPVVFPPEDGTYWSTHYAYWSGSSFAAPLVSGLAALSAQVQVATPTAIAVGASVVESTCPSRDPNLPGGIINLPHALLGEDCPTPTPP